MLMLLAEIAAVATARPALAPADWQVVAYGDNGSQVSSDRARVVCRDGVCKATELTEYLKPRPNGVVRTIDDVEYDCDRTSTRTLAETSFDARGRPTGHIGQVSPWSSLEAGSIGFQSMAFACTWRPVSQPAAVLPTGPPAMPPKPTPAGLKAKDTATVQIASSPTPDGARTALAALGRAHPESSAFRGAVEKAIVRGRVTYRAVLEGFASQDDATAFCRRLQLADGCLVRSVRPKAGG